MPILAVLLGALFICVLQGWLYKKFWRRGLELNLDFERDCAFEGDRLTLIEVLSNNKLLPLPWVTVKFNVSRELVFDDQSNAQVSDHYYRNEIFSIVMRQRITRRLMFTCSKRGYYTIKSADLISANIIGTESFAQRMDCPSYLTVYPAFAEAEGLEVPFKRISGSVVAKSILEPDPFEFRGIREYHPSDRMRQINFKASAKLGTLMSNEYNQTLSQEVVLVLNLEKYTEWQTDDLYEYAIRLAASLCNMATEAGIPLRFCTNGRDLYSGEECSCETGSGEKQLYRILELMARIDLSQELRQKSTDLLAQSIVDSRQEPIYILVSPYCRPDLQEAYEHYAEQAFDSLWIIPYYEDEPQEKLLQREDIIPWEVKL